MGCPIKPPLSVSLPSTSELPVLICWFSCVLVYKFCSHINTWFKVFGDIRDIIGLAEKINHTSKMTRKFEKTFLTKPFSWQLDNYIRNQIDRKTKWANFYLGEIDIYIEREYNKERCWVKSNKASNLYYNKWTPISTASNVSYFTLAIFFLIKKFLTKGLEPLLLCKLTTIALLI